MNQGALPSGTVTFLFTDIEGSTQLLKHLGEDYGEVLAEHQRLLRAAFEHAAGREIDTQGDAFFAAFPRAKDAVAAALEGQRALAAHSWPGGVQVRVRMGLHTGEPSVAGERYIGLGVHRAARICAAAHGGQLLVSQATYAVLVDEVLPDIGLRDLGEHRLKDIDRSEHIYQLAVPDLPSDFPPPRTLETVIPAAVPFAGREHELATVVATAMKKGDVRVVVADDSVLLREGLVRLLDDAGFQVVGKAGDSEELLDEVARTRPAVAITDIKMPPTHTDEGLRAAEQIRREHPSVGVLVLSQYLESRYAMRLLEHYPERVGYLLKDRVSDVAVLTDALHRIGQGECVIDPTIVSRLLARHHSGPLADLTAREREILALMAEGHANDGICRLLFLSPKTVEGHIHQIFLKLDLGETPSSNRRVLAVLRFLRPG